MKYSLLGPTNLERISSYHKKLPRHQGSRFADIFRTNEFYLGPGR